MFSLMAKSQVEAKMSEAYNLIAQRDSEVMKEVSKATKTDSAAMKTIAVMTMAFLPATFTCVRLLSFSPLLLM